MKKLLSASVRGTLLLLIAFLVGRTTGFGAEVNRGQLLAAVAPPATKAPLAVVSAAETSSTVHDAMPRYYFGGYTKINEKGDAIAFNDPVQIDDYLHKLKNWIPDRILESVPNDCSKINPCEELLLREETSGIEVILWTEIRQNPVVDSASKIPHKPLRNQTAMKETWLDTRSCLSAKASYLILMHDKLNRDELHHETQ